MNMYSKNQEKGDSLSKKNIRIPQLLGKNTEKKSKSKSGKRDYSNSIQYGTDSKKPSHSQSYQLEMEEMRAVIMSCNSCLQKISQFTTKKHRQESGKQEKWTQTTHKPFLVDLIEERLNDICRQNRKLSKMILEKEADLMDKQSEISEIEDKFTSILYTLGQELSRLRLLKDQVYELKHGIGWEIETPSYLKALMMERQ